MAEPTVADVKVEDVQIEQPAVTAEVQAEAITEDVKPKESETEDTKVDVKEETMESEVETKEDVKAKGEKGPARYENGVLKTTAREHEDTRKNNKYDPSLAPKPSADKVPGEIRKQVDFYFSDSNLPGDAYLWKLTNGVANQPVPVESLMTFGRMKIFTVQDVVSALKTSNFVNITGEEGKEKVSRKVAYDPTTDPKVIKKAQDDRSVYVKGFGDETPTHQFDIEAFFTPYGPTNAIRLRRTQEKLFKGSVFVEFESEELAKAFLELDPKPLWKGDNILLIMPKTEYMSTKEQEIRDGKITPSATRGYRGGRGHSRSERGDRRGSDRGGRGGRGRGGRGNRGGDRGGRGRGNRDRGGDRDPDDWKKRREDDRANGFKNKRDRDEPAAASEEPAAKKAKAEETP